MLRALMDKVDSVQEQMDNVSRGQQILGKDQKEILEIKITVTEIKNIIDGLTINSRLDITEENFYQLCIYQ